jgi:O-antigen/teichoic acid export membrane protein
MPGRMKLSHITWNFGGLALPLLMAVVAIPKLLQILGPERFGILTLAWGLIGYAGALDLGIGRAATHSVSKLKASGLSDSLKIPNVLFTAARMTVAVGTAGAFVMLAILLIGAKKFLLTSQIQPEEIYISAVLMALALPMQALSSTYRGINEAYLNFKSISVLRVALGVANFGLPLLIALHSEKIYWLIASIVVSRAIALCIYKALASKCILELKKNRPVFSRLIAKDLARFGGWFTVSGILNAVVSLADRFTIGILISAAFISVYVVPYEMVVQSLTVVGALTTVAFPYLSALRISDPKNAKKKFKNSLLAILFLMACITAFYFNFGGRILLIWLGQDYSDQHNEVIKILSLGLMSYTLGTMCISWLHAHGKTATTAKLNLIEFPLYLAAIYLGIKFFGVQGAATVWVGRVTTNALILYYFASKLNEE